MKEIKACAEPGDLEGDLVYLKVSNLRVEGDDKSSLD